MSAPPSPVTAAGGTIRAGWATVTRPRTVGPRTSRPRASFTPLADIEECDTAWTIEAELPGVDKKDVEVEVNGRTVVISGERKEKERTGVLRRRRRVTGSFRYEVTLGGDFDAEGITANLTDGELVNTVPKAVADQPRKITVG